MFGKIKWINHWDLDKPVDEQQALAHGYVMQDGEVHGLTGMTLLTNRVGSVITSMDVTATDRRGTVHRLHGAALMGGPLVCYLSTHVQASTMRWQLDSGRVGYGLAQRPRRCRPSPGGTDDAGRRRRPTSPPEAGGLDRKPALMIDLATGADQGHGLDLGTRGARMADLLRSTVHQERP